MTPLNALRASAPVRWLVALLPMTALLLGILWVVWMGGFDANAVGAGLSDVAVKAKSYRWGIATVRWGLWIAAWRYWTPIGAWFIGCRGPSDAKVQSQQLADSNNQRGTVMALIAVMEAVIVISFLRF